MGTYGNDIDAAMVVQIKAEMAARDWKQPELAKRAGISTSAMHRYMNGERKMKLSDFGNIAEALGLSYLELATRAQRRLDTQDVR
jgi:transcriptional regulator with XRE-family HTH domain